MIESCCIIVVLLFVVFVVLVLATKNRGSTQRDPPHPPPPEYIPTYRCSQCGLYFVQPEEIEKEGSKLLVCPECKKEII